MKKTISTILVCVLLLSSVFVLASCDKMLVGKYRAEIDLVLGSSSVTYEFGLFGKLTCTTNSLGKETVTEGKYEFNDDGSKITFIYEKEDGTPETETYDFKTGTEDGVDYIKLGSVEYYKIKD